jgi:hypothetical protein
VVGNLFFAKREIAVFDENTAFIRIVHDFSSNFSRLNFTFLIVVVFGPSYSGGSFG